MSWKDTQVPGLPNKNVGEALGDVKTALDGMPAEHEVIPPNPATQTPGVTAGQLATEVGDAENANPSDPGAAVMQVKTAYEESGSDWGKVKAALDDIAM